MASPPAGVTASPGVLGLSLNVLVWLLMCLICFVSQSPIKIKVAEKKNGKKKQENREEGTRQVNTDGAGTPYSKTRHPKISIYDTSIVYY